jgi:hypothetical protein
LRLFLAGEPTSKGRRSGRDQRQPQHVPAPRGGEATAPWRACLEGRSGCAVEPGDAQPPLPLSFRAWREVDGHLVPPVPPGEGVPGAGEDVADRQPGKEEPERDEDGPHRRECTPFGRFALRGGVSLGGRREKPMDTLHAWRRAHLRLAPPLQAAARPLRVPGRVHDVFRAHGCCLVCFRRLRRSF